MPCFGGLNLQCSCATDILVSGHLERCNAFVSEKYADRSKQCITNKQRLSHSGALCYHFVAKALSFSCALDHSFLLRFVPNNQEENATSRDIESTTPEHLAASEAMTPTYTGEGKEEERQNDLDDGVAGMEKAAAPRGGAIVVDDEGLDKVGPWLVL